jgi:tRNA(fMet)-specific endonuclease VapC
MRRVLLDTNVISEVLKRRPSPAVVRRLRAVPSASLFTSTVCLMELRFGAARHPSGGALWARIERDVLPLVDVVPFGVEEARRAGDVLADLEAAGTPIGVEDVMIAATALEHRLAVATRNLRHLTRVRGLTVEDWFA